jgi:hypothetical protein
LRLDRELDLKGFIPGTLIEGPLVLDSKHH